MNRIHALPLILAGTFLAAQAPGLQPPGSPGQPMPCGLAQAGPGAGMPGPGGMQPMHPQGRGMEQAGPMADLRALSLTPEQTKAVFAVLEKHRATAMARRKAVGQKEDALRAATLDPATPEARLRALAAEAAEARLQDLLEQRAVTQEMNALFTPEQQAKAARIRVVRQKEHEAHQALMEELGDPAPMPPPPPHQS